MNTSGAAAAPAPLELGDVKRLPIMISLIIGAFFSIAADYDFAYYRSVFLDTE
ncbi:MAG: hypothetical protein K0R28_7099 [Paenibacillus sp.]|nr:hypothetical protein [Paenibacillus sp.]